MPLIFGMVVGFACVFGSSLGVGRLKNTVEAVSKYFLSLKVGLLAHISGQPPAMAIGFARKALMSEVRPTFVEVEAAKAALPATA